MLDMFPCWVGTERLALLNLDICSTGLYTEACQPCASFTRCTVVCRVSYKACSLLGRAERVTAPTALPTVMESADGPQEARRPRPGALFTGVSTGPYAMVAPQILC